MDKACCRFYVVALVWLVFLGASFGSTGSIADKREAVLSVARSQIGVREQGHNSGPQVKRYLRSIGLNEGYNWCMAFTHFCFDSAGVKVVKSGWTPAWFPAQRCIVWGGEVRQLPQPADVFGLFYRHLGRLAHGGIIESWGSVVITIEGNTNAQGSREGSGVWRRRRLPAQIYAVSKWI